MTRVISVTDESEVREGRRYEAVRMDGKLFLVPIIEGGTPLRKHGGHLHNIALPKIAIGSSLDTSANWHYSVFASQLGVVDPVQEYLLAAALVTDAAITGAATNFFAVDVRHYDNAANLKNRLEYVFGNTFNAAAFVPISLFGTAGGGATGGLYNPTGTVLPWALQAGDTISVARTSTSAGLASPAFTVNFLVGPKV